MTKRLIVFASGTATDGGSGAENLVLAQRSGRLDADIVALVSNHRNGGVAKRADKLDIPFLYFPKDWEGGGYEGLRKAFNADFIALSGWLKPVRGHDPRTTFNIHPGPLPRFGGKGMYGHHVHEAVMKAHKAGEVTHSAVSMHFVTDGYDEGPVFLQHEVFILPNDTPETLAKRVNEAEHRLQPEVTDMVVNGEISWDGKHPSSLRGSLVGIKGSL